MRDGPGTHSRRLGRQSAIVADERAPLRDPLVATAIRGRALRTRAVIGVAHLADCHQGPAGTAPCSRWAQPDVFHVALADVQELALPIPRLRGQLVPWRLRRAPWTRSSAGLPRLSPEGTS
ncbi:hypothetical protein [Streptomyces sp. NPDC051992]|uniref:hypothetical protein n=1 Tax=unclassified Streptomyces TaxID=2593676 RepID=UPI0034317D02